MIYSLGIDMSKDDFSACLQSYDLCSQSHQVISRKTFKNKPSGFKACMSWLARHTRNESGPVRMTMEATGVYYEPFALFVREHHSQIHLSVVLPSQSNKYIESRGLRSKTDKIDAYGLALMGGERKLDAWKGIDPFWRKLRVYTRTRAELLEQRTQLRNQHHALDHSGTETPKAEQALRECIQTISGQIDELTNLIGKLLRSRKDLRAQISCLRSIPGIGTLTIASILAETNGFAEFHKISQLISFSGYDVKIKESGKWAGKPKISKQGSKYIRRAMYMPATTITRTNEGPIYELYQRLLATHNIKMKAHVAVQKKLLTYMYILWKRKEYFDPDIIRNQRKEHQKKVAPPESEATVDTPLVLTQ
jgi:transposase